MPSTPFPLLGDAQYVTYLQPFAHRGGNATTHLAEVRYPVQAAPIESVVKLMEPGGLAACNEAMAWLFLRAAGVTAPTQAALMALSEAKMVKVLGRKAVPPNLVNAGVVLAWASRRMGSESIRVMFSGTKADDRMLAMLRTVSGAAVAAFDEVFLNTDRNTGNLLFTDAQTCVAIDHEHAFGDQDWRQGKLEHLPREGDSLRRLRNAQRAGQLPLADLETALNRMAHHAEQHAAALQECREQIAQLLGKVYQQQGATMADRVLTFLTARTAEQWIKDRLGVT